MDSSALAVANPAGQKIRARARRPPPVGRQPGWLGFASVVGTDRGAPGPGGSTAGSPRDPQMARMFIVPSFRRSDAGP
jgi:hypothetical protein